MRSFKPTKPRFALGVLFAFVCSCVAFTSSPAKAIVTSGLIQDLNADLGVTTSGPTNVTDWANQAAGGGDNVSINAGSPQLVTGAVNGHNAIAFTNDRMAGTSETAFDGIMQGSGHTWFAVVRAPNNPGGKNAVFGTLLNNSPWTGVVAHIGGSNARYMTRPANGDVFANGTTNIADGGFHVIGGRLAAGTGSQLAELFVDDPTAEATAMPSINAGTNSSQFTVGAERAGGNERVDADIARILIYDRPLTDAEFHQTGDSLSQTYGLVNAFRTDIPQPQTLLEWTFDAGDLFDTTGTVAFQAVSGTAFGAQPIPYAPTPDNVDANNPFGGGTHLVRSDFFDTPGPTVNKHGDGPQGVLESDPFTLDSFATITFQTAGNGGVLELVDFNTNMVLESVDPNRTSVTLAEYQIDASAYAGQTVFLRIVDDSSGGWGHIAIDNINYSAVATAAVPEPVTATLLAPAMLALLRRRGRRQRA